MKKGQNTNHPEKGSRIKIEPFKSKKTIADLQKLLAGNPFDFALLKVGLNTNLRASDLLNLKVEQVKDLKPNDVLGIREKKTGKEKMIKFKAGTISAIQNLLKSRDYEENDFLFIGQRGSVIRVESLNLKIKRWAKRLNLKGNFGSHTFRKTWAYMQYKFNNAPLPKLMKALNHSSQAITLRYICVPEKEIADLYDYEL
jgi:integrase